MNISDSPLAAFTQKIQQFIAVNRPAFFTVGDFVISLPRKLSNTYSILLVCTKGTSDLRYMLLYKKKYGRLFLYEVSEYIPIPLKTQNVRNKLASSFLKITKTSKGFELTIFYKFGKHGKMKPRRKQTLNPVPFFHYAWPKADAITSHHIKYGDEAFTLDDIHFSAPLQINGASCRKACPVHTHPPDKTYRVFIFYNRWHGSACKTLVWQHSSLHTTLELRGKIYYFSDHDGEVRVSESPYKDDPFHIIG